MTFGSLFSGAGGFDMGLEAAGLSCVWQVEIDKTARSVLARHWPNVPKFNDVRTVGKHDLSPVDVVVGGFPCQDLSIAGNRSGLAGSRSGLFYELARITRELRPRFLVWENVAGLLSSDDGRDFARVLRHLADSGYFGAWRVLDAEGFGVAQTRRRVFGAFARGGVGAGCCVEILALRESVCRHTPAGGQAGTEVARTLGGGTAGRGWSDDLERAGAFIPTVARSLTAGQSGPGVSAPGRRQEDDFNLVAFGGNDTRGTRRVAACLNGRSTCRQDFETETFIVNSATSEAKESHARQSDLARSLDTTGGFASGQGGTVVVGPGIGVRRMTPRECERVMGWPDDHTRYRADGSEIKDGPRYRLIGNGVVKTKAEWIGRRLIEASRTDC